MTDKQIPKEEIVEFLEGRDPQKYIVAVEATYQDDFVHLIINDPETGKKIEQHKFTPFLWLKEDVSNLLYEGNKQKIQSALDRFNVKIKPLTTSDENGNTPDRLEDGYKFIAKCNGNYTSLLNFFKYGGVDVFDAEFRKLFVTFSPVEQYMIQSGKRLFKGFEDYDDLHRYQFDLETEGLDAETDAIFQIGIKDNRGFEHILETKGDTPQEKRDSERENIITFFRILDEIKPDIVSGYNSEFFDWDFFEKRCIRLGMNLSEVAITLNPNTRLTRRDSTLKLGSDSEFYKQTYMWGYNILDISHAVRRAQAINSSIKSWGLKYVTKFSKVAKPNRVYIQGDKIHSTWADQNDYWFIESDGSFGKVKEETPNPEGSTIVKGDFIVKRYLIDDLWETEEVDKIYNQASFLIAKLLPTSYGRSSTMGTATQWKLIMAAWSYEKGLAIPSLESKREFTGGLARLLEVGYARGVVKFDYAALYPKAELTHDIFPDLDISGVMKGLLTYIVDTRDEFKNLTNKHKKRVKELKDGLDEQRDSLDAETIAKIERAIIKHEKLKSDYDKKQLPLKTLANSWFGAYGAPYIFNWGETNCAEETTCRSRQYLRLMVKFFVGYGFRPLVGDTDGFNFAIPDDVNSIKYTCKASHWKTERYKEGEELTGIDAALAEFNETYMIGRMGLDIDDICESTINFKRKNYANDIDGEVKLVGNSIKSKAMPVYIEEFIDKGIRLLLDGKGYEFIQWYYEYVDKIFEYKIPVAKMASKSRVKVTSKYYQDVYCKQKTKTGGFKARQAHMELVVKNDLNVNLGDTIYYINTGTAKSHSDVKKTTNKETGKTELQFYCELIPQQQLESDPNLIITNYNVAKYLEAFNTRIKPLLVCFSEEVRDKVIIKLTKDRKTNVVKLVDRSVFTEKECTLVAGKPFNSEDQDTYDDLLTMEDKEIRFWDSVNMIPNNMEEEEWNTVRADWLERNRIERLEGIKNDKEYLTSVCNRLETAAFIQLNEFNELPKEITNFCNIKEHNGEYYLFSNKWDVPLQPFNYIFEFEELARERQHFYNTVLKEHTPEELYELWEKQYDVEEPGPPINDGEASLEEIKEIEKTVELDMKKRYESKTGITVKEQNEMDEWNF